MVLVLTCCGGGEEEEEEEELGWYRRQLHVCKVGTVCSVA